MGVPSSTERTMKKRERELYKPMVDVARDSCHEVIAKPRRLPALPGSTGLTRGRLTGKSRATTSKENDIYTKEDKGFMVEIRRIGALADKGKMAKESAKRRQEVIARKEARLKEKRKTIENKLKRENQAAEKNIPKSKKEKRIKPERKTRPNKPAVSVLSSVSV
ncbi:unnamed protein product [Mytilus coruscus]|uniref:Uncharacterized protein n=1 Tax=Mytilus coruscus TaxID=42192 RepID=A0A6J8F2L6_MYTCO|nr:unnamed protein product [Mytilus coruscus]